MQSGVKIPKHAGKEEHCNRQDLVQDTCGLIGKAPDSDLGIAGSNPAMRSDQGLVA